ncbi:MAG: ATP synthase subunit I [Lutibacter sp.]|nr:ATP synthase subunit I [Lutibacter sp.]
MNEVIQFIFIIATGAVLGALFFGGLWLTVKKSVSAKNPAWLIFGSLIVRMTIAMFGFYYLSQFGLQAMLLGLFGFIAARFMVLFFTKKYDKKENLLK